MDSIIIKAAQYAKEAHKDQKRKYTEEPYITHPARVAGQVAMLEKATPIMVAAAYLHDVIEDTETTKQNLIDQFGLEVANLVDELTNQYTKEAHPTMNRKGRKENELIRLAGISNNAKIIKMLDRIDNLKEIDINDDFTEVYLEESSQLWDKIKDADQKISTELYEVIADKKWKIHSNNCQDCEFFPISPACETGAKLFRETWRDPFPQND